MTTATATTPELITLDSGKPKVVLLMSGKVRLDYPDGSVVAGPDGDGIELSLAERWLEYHDSFSRDVSPQ